LPNATANSLINNELIIAILGQPPREVESYGKNLKVVEEWSYLEDEDVKPKLYEIDVKNTMDYYNRVVTKNFFDK